MMPHIPSAKDVLKTYRDVFRSLPARFQYSSFLDIRFTAGDASWLATSSGRTTIWIDLIRPNAHTDTEVFMNSFKSTIIKYGGRPHFGKENIIDHDELQKCFPHLRDFIEVRDELDPHKLFSNPYYESLIGSAGRPITYKFNSLRTGSVMRRISRRLSMARFFCKGRSK